MSDGTTDLAEDVDGRGGRGATGRRISPRTPTDGEGGETTIHHLSASPDHISDPYPGGAPSGIDAQAPSNDAPVHIVPYDPDWPSRFGAERTLLIEAIGPWLAAGSIEHIGSTAAPGLDAKPVLDIMAGVEPRQLSYGTGHPRAPPVLLRSLSNWADALAVQTLTGSAHAPPACGAVESPLWNEQLAFRNYLRTHPDVPLEYPALKRRLAETHRLDREAYTTAKARFVQRVLGEALRSR